MLRSPLWRLYLFILSTLSLLAVAATLFVWSNIKEKSSIELGYIARFNAVSMSSLLGTYQVILKDLGERLLAAGVSNPEATRQIMDRVLADQPGLAGIALVDTDGTFLSGSSNIATGNLPNLVRNPRSAVSFRECLEMNRLVLGHTYFFEGFGKWVIPLRLALRDASGTPVAVVSTGLDLESDAHTMKVGLPEGIVLHFVRDDFFLLYDSSLQGAEAYRDAYATALPEGRTHRLADTIRNSHGMDLEAFKHSHLGVAFENFHNDAWTDVVTYNDDFDFYMVAGRAQKELFAQMAPYLGLIAVGTLGLIALITFVFRYVARIQNQSREQLHYQAHHDPLTGLPNRFYLDERYRNWCAGTECAFAIFFIDLNNFKSINDQYGHPMGDRLLIQVARRLQSFFSDEHIIIRQGGDEFIVFLPLDEAEQLIATARRFIEHLHRPIYIDDADFVLTASIGIVRTPLDGTERDDLLRKADMAMYEAKKNLNSIVLFSESMHRRILREAHIKQELFTALENGEFHVVYQPQIHAQNGFVAGVEALVRWHSHVLGNVGPDEFIPLAEECGHINAIGNFVIATAFREISALQGPLQSIRVSINVSVRQLFSPGFKANLLECCAESGIVPVQVTLEITESLFIEDINSVDALLQELCREGFTISLDDFGTGYSSLHVLSKLPIGEVKIDKSFVRDILTDEQDCSLIQSIIGIGRGLEIPTLAEGVETLEQALVLKSYGCDLFQGYYFSRPIGAEALREYLERFTPYRFS